MHQVSNPSILYFGTPVVLISSLNEDGSYNLAPISSIFWLGYRCVIGISAFSKTTENILREKECVLNLPSVKEVCNVNRLALTTGTNPVPEGKKQKGYRYVKDKFAHSGFTALSSHFVDTPRVAECPVQLESKLISIHPLSVEKGASQIKIFSMELKIVRVHMDKDIIKEDNPNHVDPDKWRPLIMSFQQFYGLGEKIHRSELATIPEHLYRNIEVEAAGA